MGVNVYEGIMQGLEEAIAYNEGKIAARSNTMHIEPIQKFEASEVKEIRTALGMTQYLFAKFMGVSQKTVEAWEAGRNRPNGSASRILALVKSDPQLPQKYNIITQ